MKTYFQTGFYTSDAREIWTKPKDIDALRVRHEVLKSVGEGKTAYHTIQFRSGNDILYPFLFIDIDSDDLKKALNSTKKLVELLDKNKLSANCYQTYFSGSKGFHLIIDTRSFFSGKIPTSDAFPPRLQRALAVLLGSQALNTDDAQPDLKIYSKKRMIRAVFSINFKSGLYKIPIYSNQLGLEISEIKTLAKSPERNFLKSFDDTLSFFSGSSEPNSFLEKCVQEALTTLNETDRGSTKTSAQQRVSKQIEKQDALKTSLLSSTEILHGCRALRELTEKVINSKTISNDERYVFAQSLFESDLQSDYIHSIFSKTDGYRRDISEENISKVFGSPNCEELISKGICKQRCTRYRKADGSVANTPSYFGIKGEQSKWAKYTESTYIATVAQRLKNYHSTTTDFFDWTNCSQFLDLAEVYAVAISDNIRKLTIPRNEDILIQVKKEENKHRELIRTHFESELTSSIFVDEALASNRRYKENKVLAENVLSYGYQNEDKSKYSLIAPWIEEYSEFKRTLKATAASNIYEHVYSDDLKDFYPSFTKEKIAALLTEIFNDKKTSQTISESLFCPLQLFSTGERVDRHIGLPQGPLISHVIASRLLLKMDEAISSLFTIEELLLVRYCDDLIFFCKDDQVLEKLTKKVIPELEREFEILFHKNVESTKTSSLSIEKYRKEQLENDLFKYQIKFESELGKADENSKQEMLDLLSNIFGSTIEKFLSRESQYNSKELERTISAIRWRIPELISTQDELTELVKQLFKKILFFLNSEVLSYKLRTNLIILALNLIGTLGTKDNSLIASLVSFFKTTTVKASRQTILHQLVRVTSFSHNDALLGLSSQILESVSGQHFDYLDNVYIKEITYKLKRSSSPAIFSHEVWAPTASNSIPNLSALIKNTLGSELDSKHFERLCRESDSIFRFYLKLFLVNFQETKKSLTIQAKYQFYNIAYRFNLEELKSYLLSETTAFIEQGLCDEIQIDDITKQKRAVHDIVKAAFGIGDESHLIILSNVGSNSVFRINEVDYLVDFSGHTTLGAISKKRRELICKRIEQIKCLGDIKIVSTPNTKRLVTVYRFPAKGQVSPYLDRSIRIEELFSCESALFDSLSKINENGLPILVLSARNIGLQKTTNTRQIVITSPSQVIYETVNATYSFHNNSNRFLKKPSRFLLPGLRLQDFSQYCGFEPDRNFPFGKVGWEYLGILSTNHRASLFYKTPKKVIGCLSSVLAYGSWLAEATTNEEIDELNYNTFLLFRDLYRRKTKIHRRRETVSVTSSSYSLISRVSSILAQTEIPHSSGNFQSDTFLWDKAFFDSTFKIDNLRSIDQIVGYSLLWMGAKSVGASKPEHQIPLALVGVVGIKHLLHALDEHIGHFGILNSSVNRAHQMLLASDSIIYSEMKANYLFPDLSNGKLVSKKFAEEASKLLKTIKTVKFRNDIRFLKISKNLEFDPFFSEDKAEKLKEISSRFQYIRISFFTEPKSFLGLIFDNLWRNYDKDHRKVGPEYLYKVLSSQHSWRIDTDKSITHYGFLSESKGRYRVSTYPKNLRLYPRKVEVIVRPKRLVFILALLLVGLLSLGINTTLKSAFSNIPTYSSKIIKKLFTKESNPNN